MAYTVNIEEFPDVVREFASYKSVIQGCSEKTVSEYLSDLRTFFRWLLAKDTGTSLEGEDFERIDIRGVDLDYIKGITTDRIYEFLVYTGSVRGNDGAAKARKLSAIKAFYKYLTVKRQKRKRHSPSTSLSRNVMPFWMRSRMIPLPPTACATGA